jgi:uncharacterized protein (DUF885 family)
MTDRAAERDPIYALCDAFVGDFARLSPVQATMCGVRGTFDGWDDYSLAGASAFCGMLSSYRERIAALPPATDRWARVARRVALEFLDDRILFFTSEDHLVDLNNIESTFQHIKMVFDLMDGTSLEGATAIAKRLETIAAPFAGYRATLEAGLVEGRGAAKRQVHATILQARVHAGPTSSLLELAKSARAALPAEAALAERIERGVATAQAAFAEMGDWLENVYLPRAPERDPVGAERYARASRRFLGDDLDPIETYAWGWGEVERIAGAMRDVAAQIRPGASLREVIESLRTEPSYSVGGLDAFLEQMRGLQSRALADLSGSHFDVPAQIHRLDVKLAPKGTALGAYYIPPSDGFSRAGTVYYVPGEDTSYPIFEEVTTAYHEGFPGHHLQCGLQVLFADRLTTLHRLLVCVSGYAEGWALYAEALMHELGYLDRPEYVLGMYLAKMFRACRVVMDIGLHLELAVPEGLSAEVLGPVRPGEVWSYDLAKKFLEHHAFTRPDFAASEITRYLGWPGQAISYKLGERILLELREEVKTSLGDRFDLKAFHGAVLSTGSVGLAHLRDVVREELGVSAPS